MAWYTETNDDWIRRNKTKTVQVGSWVGRDKPVAVGTALVMLPISLTDRPDLINVRNLDLAPLPMLARMMRYGTAIDLDYLSGLSEELGDTKSDLEKEIRKHVPASRFAEWKGKAEVKEDDEGDDESAGVENSESLSFNVNSPEQVAWFLFDTLGLGEGQNLKRTPDGKRISTGKKQLEVLKGEHEVVKLLLDFREAAKLKSTYCDALPHKAVLHPKGRCPYCSIPGDDRTHRESHYRIHTTFTSTRAATGRLASKAPNLQNIPKRSKIGKRIRAAFIPQPGMKWVSADFSQIELRILAHYSNDPYMRHIYGIGGDIHSMTAMRAFGISEQEFKSYDSAALKEFEDYKRLPCKNVNFGIVYGLTAKGLQAQLTLSGIYWSEEECQLFIDRWFAVFTGVRPYMQQQEYRVLTYGFNWDIWGRVRWYPGIHSVHRRIVAEALREAGNTPIQGSSAGLTKYTMALAEQRDRTMYDTEGALFNPLLTIHDEVIYEAEESIAEDLLALNLSLMSSAIELRVPVLADGKVKDRW